jgi:hypothetical protein
MHTYRCRLGREAQALELWLTNASHQHRGRYQAGPHPLLSLPGRTDGQPRAWLSAPYGDGGTRHIHPQTTNFLKMGVPLS